MIPAATHPNNLRSDQLTDQQVLLTRLLHQSIDDYIKLAHPLMRTKKYLQEYYLLAIDMLFDPEFTLAAVQDEDGKDMGLQTLLEVVLRTERNEVPRLQTYIVQEAERYWAQRTVVSALNHIPDTVYIQGHTFNVEHKAIERYRIDTEGLVIQLNKEETPRNHQNFLEAVIATSMDLLDMDISIKEIREFTGSFFQTLKVNACFNKVGVAPQSDLFLNVRHSDS